MKNQKYNRNGALPDRRRLRFETLESRLPFAVDAIPLDVDLWLMPEAEVFFDEQWISALNNKGNDVRATVPLDALPVEVAYLMPDLLDTTSSYRDVPEDNIAILAQPMAVVGTTVPLVEDVFPTDLDLFVEDALLSNSGDLVPVDLSMEQVDDAPFSQYWWISAIVSRAVRFPLDRGTADGPAIPVWEFVFSDLEGDAGDAELIEFGESILIGEVELSDVMPVTEVLTGKGDSASPFSAYAIVEGGTEVGKLAPNNLPTDGSFGKTTEVAVGDAEAIEFGEPILIVDVELSDVMPVTEVLTGKGTPASPVSGIQVAEGRIEAGKLAPNNLPTDGSFGKRTEVAASKVEKKSVASTTPWNGESVQRKRSSGSLRNQLVDSALIELLQF